MGHTAVRFLEDDRLQVSAANVPDDSFACIAHNTYQAPLALERLLGAASEGNHPHGSMSWRGT